MYFPSFLSFIDHVLAKDSSVCAVRISSQSFERVEEYEIEVTGGNLSDVIGIERLVAFFAKDPTLKNQYTECGTVWRSFTLAKLETPRVPDDARTPHTSISGCG